MQRTSPITVLAVRIALLAAAAAARHGHAAEVRPDDLEQFRRTPVTLDLSRIAVFHRAGGDAAGDGSLREAIAAAGIDPATAVEHHDGRWRLAATPPAARHEAGVEALADALAAGPGVDFVTPVLRDDRGEPVLLTPDLYVRFETDVPAARVAAIVASLEAAELLGLDWSGLPGVARIESRAGTGKAVLAAAAALEPLPEVRWVTIDVVQTGRLDLLPSDGHFPSQWGLHNLGQGGGLPDFDLDGPEAWDITTGSSSVRVAIIDTGVQQDHPDINQLPGADFTSDGPGDGGPVTQWDNHGTAVAGVVSAVLNNGGAVGIAPGVKILSARIGIEGPTPDDFTTQASWVADAINWSYWTAAADITNMSFTISPSQLVDDALAFTRGLGLVHFAATGNEADPVIGYPSSNPDVNAVTSVNRYGLLSSFSDTGVGLAFCAPGSELIVVDRTGTDGYVNGDIGIANGTSGATPYAAGVAALALSVNPSLTPDEVEQVLRDSAQDLGAPGYDTTFGWGFVNAHRAILAAQYGAACGPGGGDCFAAHGAGGCEDADCCAVVCAADPACCAGPWDAGCAAQAALLCVANDDCADAIPVTNGDTVFSSVNATTDGPIHDDCDFYGTPALVHNDLWFDYTATFTGFLHVSTCGSADFGMSVAVYQACSCPVSFIDLIGCEAAGCGGGTDVSVYVTTGDCYRIRLGGYFASSEGTGTLTLTPQPLWDNCEQPFILSDYEGSININTIDAVTDGPAHADCDFFNDDQVHSDVWVRYYPPCSGILTVDTCGTADFDTKLAAYEGIDCPTDDSTLIACNDDAGGCAGNTSRLSFSVAQYQPVTIRVGGFNGAQGTGTLAFDCGLDIAPWDINGDLVVDVTDLLTVLAAWGTSDPEADIEPSGLVDIADLLLVLGHWGPVFPT